MNAAQRTIAGLGGLLLLGIVATFTVGLALAAPIGMLGAGVVARHRHVTLTPGASWLGACVAVMVTIVALGGVFAFEAPKGTFSEMQHNYDSVSTAAQTQPPPAWLERFAPGAARSQSNAIATRFGSSRPVMIWATIVGGSVGAAMISVLIGTLGWGAGLLLAYAALGRWISAQAAA